ncbi:MAG TPA: glycosyltransferase family 39 protein, partial [Anaerolineales bacterium]
MTSSSPAAQAKPHPFWLYALILLALVAPPHLLGLDRFATIDEPWWVISGSNFYYAITHGDFANTIYDYHPAVTTTWVVTGGMLATFPQYRGFGQGYFDVRKPNFDEFMQQHGKETRDLLRNSRLIQSLLLIGLAVLLFFLLQKLLPPGAALTAVVLAFDAPFFLGHSRLLNHEGMLTMFMLVSLVSMFVFLRVERRPVYLLLSGAAFGLAQLTKSSSIALAAVIGVMLLLDLAGSRKTKPFRSGILDLAKTLAIWLGSAALVYVLVWPGMWVAPGRMLYQVYGNAFSYAFQGARLDVTQQLQPESFSLDTGLGGVPMYLRLL